MSTASPTPLPTVPATEWFVTWVLFGVFLLLALVSPWLAKLFFLVGRGLRFNGKSISWWPEFQMALELPMTLSFIILFVYLAFITFLPWSADTEWLYNVVNLVIRFFAWLVIFFVVYRVLRFSIWALGAVMLHFKVESTARRGVTEAAYLLMFIVMFFLALVLIITLNPDYSSAELQSMLTLFAQVNAITATAAVAVTPVFRDIVAGLTLFVDRPFRVGHEVELSGVTTRARVLEYSLRSTTMRLMDERVLHVPNNKFQKYPLINFSARPTVAVRVEVKLQWGVSSEDVRGILADVEALLLGTFTTSTNPEGKPDPAAARSGFANETPRTLTPRQTGLVLSRPAGPSGAAVVVGGGEVEARPPAPLPDGGGPSSARARVSQADAAAAEPADRASRAALGGGAAVVRPAEPYAYVDDDNTLVVMTTAREHGYIGEAAARSDLLLKLTEVLEGRGVGVRLC